jgi:tetratricopeptide (TPR) repeat protein
MLPFRLYFRRIVVLSFSLSIALTLTGPVADSQSSSPIRTDPNVHWDGKRIVMLTGFGDYFAQSSDGKTVLVKPDGLGVNIVAVAHSVEGDRVWIEANGNGDAPVGWINKGNAILLDGAIEYFTSRVEHDPHDWDSFLRRAEAEHALNKRDAAIADYSRAIELHSEEPFLFLRRGRMFRILKNCPRAAADFEQAARLRPDWAEAYNMAAGVYVDCPDASWRDPAKAIALIKHAMTLSPNPTYLTVLALAYFRSGDLDKAVAEQRQAVESPAFPPGYREEALRQLHDYEAALAARKH